MTARPFDAVFSNLDCGGPVMPANTEYTVVCNPPVTSPTHTGRSACVVPRLRGLTTTAARRRLTAAHCAGPLVHAGRRPRRAAGRHHHWLLVLSRQSLPAGTRSTGSVTLTAVWRALRG